MNFIRRLACVVSAAIVAGAPAAAAAATDAVIYDFKNSGTGFQPEGALTKIGNRLYGVTKLGGANHRGTLYSVSLGGAHTILHSFAGGSDGDTPSGTLLNIGGTLYGTTQQGGMGAGCGSSGCGTLFSYAADGTYNVLHGFSKVADGSRPLALTVLGGTIYGIAYEGGGPCNCGTAFKLTPDGNLAAIYSFSNTGTDGYYPTALTSHGTMLFGTTLVGGGAASVGTVFSLTASGTLITLHSFDRAKKGDNPSYELLATRNALYGTAPSGNCRKGACGVVYKLSYAGKFSILHSFTGPDGEFPEGGLTLFHGALYGTTAFGGDFGTGIVYTVTPRGAFNTIYAFGSAAGDGAGPEFSLTAAGNSLYGVLEQGAGALRCGVPDCGAVFKVTP